MPHSSYDCVVKGAAMLGDDEEDDDEVGEVLTLPLQAHHAMEKMEEFVHKVMITTAFAFQQLGLFQNVCGG